ncbi:hypothetical protein Ancab_018193 [Ancistrocladus abbreviatus]
MTMVPAQNLSKPHHSTPYYTSYSGANSIGGVYCGGGTKYTDGVSVNVMTRLAAAAAYDYTSNSNSNSNGNSNSNVVVCEPAYLGTELAVGVITSRNTFPNNYNSNSMADDESRTNSFNKAAGSSSNKLDGQDDDHPDQHQGWLRLGIGTHGHPSSSSAHQHPDDQNLRKSTSAEQIMVDPAVVAPAHQRGGAAAGLMLELNLLPGGGTTSSSSSCSFSQQLQARPPLATGIIHAQPFPLPRPLTGGVACGVPTFSAAAAAASSLIFHHQQQGGAAGSSFSFPPCTNIISTSIQHHQDHIQGWGIRPPPINIINPRIIIPSTSASSSSSVMLPGPFFSGRAFPPHFGVDGGGPSSSDDIRVIDPPRRPHSGIWFMLQASQNQAREPYLPQVAKSYLRIRDARMTVALLIKYLVNKLGLDSESEVEITCRGQQLQPSLTLQHVRDNIWSPRGTDGASITLLPDSSTSDHVMLLHYGRSSHTNFTETIASKSCPAST